MFCFMIANALDGTFGGEIRIGILNTHISEQDMDVLTVLRPEVWSSLPRVCYSNGYAPKTRC